MSDTSSVYISGKQLLIFIKDTKIVLGSNLSHLFLIKTLFYLYNSNIICWILLTDILASMNGFPSQHIYINSIIDTIMPT